MCMLTSHMTAGVNLGQLVACVWESSNSGWVTQHFTGSVSVSSFNEKNFPSLSSFTPLLSSLTFYLPPSLTSFSPSLHYLSLSPTLHPFLSLSLPFFCCHPSLPIYFLPYGSLLLLSLHLSLHPSFSFPSPSFLPHHLSSFCNFNNFFSKLRYYSTCHQLLLRVGRKRWKVGWKDA